MAANTQRVVILEGNGIGPEVIGQARRVAEWFADKRKLPLDFSEPAYGPTAYRKTGKFLPERTYDEIANADAVLFGAMGGPEQEAIPKADRAGGLRELRQRLDVFANLRPVVAWDAALDASSLKREVIEGVDMVIVRELTSGIYFGEPRGIEQLPDGRKRGVNTWVYTSDEVERVARVAFELARTRRSKVCSIDKANVMEAGVMWRDEVQRLRDEEFPDVEVTHYYVDNAAMQIVRNPRQFDVIVTDNMFGDILSDCAAMISGSLGMLPSASLSAVNRAGRRKSLYEPIHGSAPDIAGKGIANPLGAILELRDGVTPFARPRRGGRPARCSGARRSEESPHSGYWGGRCGTGFHRRNGRRRLGLSQPARGNVSAIVQFYPLQWPRNQTSQNRASHGANHPPDGKFCSG